MDIIQAIGLLVAFVSLIYMSLQKALKEQRRQKYINERNEKNRNRPEVIRQQTKTQPVNHPQPLVLPKVAPKIVLKPIHIPPTTTRQPSSSVDIRKLLKDTDSVRNAMVLREILSPPKSLQP